MSASFYRPAPVRQQLIDSLLVTPPDLIELGGVLSDASINSAWAAEGVERARRRCEPPDDDMLAEAETSLGKAYRAVVAFRGRQ